MNIFVVTSLDDSDELDSELTTGGPVGGPYTVDGVADNDTNDGDGLTLREAVNLANLFREVDGSASVITFDESLQDEIYRLIEGEIVITSTVTIDGDIDGDDVADVIISGDALGDDLDENGLTLAQGGTGITDFSNTDLRLAAPPTLTDNSRIFVAESSSDATFDSLILTGGVVLGTPTVGGAAIRGEASFTLTNSEVIGNFSSGGAGGALFSRTGATISASTLQNNVAGIFSNGGGAIYSLTPLIISDSYFEGNTAMSRSGGAVNSQSLVSVTNSTFVNNRLDGISTDAGGAIAASVVSVTNSTFVDNSTDSFNGSGGAIFSRGNLSFTNSTATGNTTAGGSAEGGALFSLRSVDVTNSLLVGNATTFAGLGDDDVAVRESTPTYAGGNIVGTSFTIDGVATGTITDAADVFAETQTTDGVVSGVLGENGTVALLGNPGNLALDAGDDSLAPSTDALGASRSDISGAANNGSSISDLGAVEAQPEDQSLIVTTLDDVIAFDGLTSLREAIAFANSDGVDSVITFGPMLFLTEGAGFLRLTEGQIDITAALTITGDVNGDGIADVTISGDALGDDELVGETDFTDIDASREVGTLSDNTRLFNITAEAGDVVLGSLILTGGYTDEIDGGGAVRTRSDLQVVNSTLTGNAAGGNVGVGGAIADPSASSIYIAGSTLSDNRTFGVEGRGGAVFGRELIITDSILTGNRTEGQLAGGGAIFALSGSAEVTDSTFSGNGTLGSLAGGGAVGVYLSSVAITSSTFAANYTIGENSGGGALSATNDVTVLNTTFTGNRTEGAGSEGGAFEALTSNSSTVTLTNNIITGNVSAENGADDIAFNGLAGATNVYTGGNVIGGVFSVDGTEDTTGLTAADIFASTAEVTDSTGTGTGVLAGIAGTDGTVALLGDIDNPALDAGEDASAPGTDALGAARVDLLGVGNEDNDISDLGAVELTDTESGLVVTTLSDVLDPFDGETSLREAIAFAEAQDGADTITFADGLTGTLRLLEGHIEIDQEVTIVGDTDGDGLADITLSGDTTGDGNNQGDSRILAVANTGSATVEALNFDGGQANIGGLVFVDNGGSFAATNASFMNGTAYLSFGDRGFGGAIAVFSGSTLSLTNVTVSNNEAGQFSGGIHSYSSTVTLENTTVSDNNSSYQAGGISNFYGDWTLENTTIANNTAEFGGGVFFNSGIGIPGETRLINSTVTGNYASVQGGGLFVGDGTLTLENSIISGNNAADQTGAEMFGSDIVPGSDESRFIVGTDMFIGSTDVGDVTVEQIFAATTEVLDAAGAGTGVFGGVLADNGGAVATVALRSGSGNPALDSGQDSAAPTTDAAGNSRVDLLVVANNGANISDLGAVELQEQIDPETPSLTVTTLDDTVDAFDGETSLREALAFAGTQDGLDTVTFSDGLSGTITLTQGQIEIDHDVEISGDTDGDGAADIALVGQGSRVLTVSSGTTTLEDLDFEGGSADEGGLLLVAAGTVYGTDVTFRNGNPNNLGDYGGAIYVRTDGTLNLSNALIADNAAFYGGGLFNYGTSILTDTSVSGNEGGYGVGGIYNRDGNLTLTNVNLSNNEGAYFGGGLYNVGNAVATLVNTTVYGNIAGEGGGIFNLGFGVSQPELILVNTTITGNSGYQAGSGVRNTNGVVRIENSIIAGNGPRVDFAGVAAAPVDADESRYIIGSNIYTGATDVGDVTTEQIFASLRELTLSNGTRTGVAAGVLADNGGSVQTVALLASLDNPAVDAGDDSLAVDADGVALSTDARGFTRPADIDAIANNGTNTVDIGAFETQSETTEGPDILPGSDDADDLAAAGGNDLVLGSLGDDTADGGEGTDTISYALLETAPQEFSGIEFGVFVDLSQQSAAQDTGAGSDTLSNFENLEGSDFADVLTGDGNDNVISGGAGADFLEGGEGNDILEGGAGFDVLDGGAGADVFYGGTDDGGTEGDIVAYFSSESALVFDFGAEITEIEDGSSADVLEDTFGDDIEGVAGASDFSNTFIADEMTGLTFFLGGSTTDTFFGGSGTDQFLGLAGDDVMYGNDGVDALIGEGGDDDLYGGEGSDVFFFDDTNEGDDTIHDLEVDSDIIFFTGGSTTADTLTIADTDADGNGETDAIISYDGGTITVIDVDAATLEAADVFLFS